MLGPPSGSWAGSLARPFGPVASIFVKLCKSRLQGARGRRAVDVSGACRRLVHEPTSPRRPEFGPTCLSEEMRQRRRLNHSVAGRTSRPCGSTARARRCRMCRQPTLGRSMLGRKPEMPDTPTFGRYAEIPYEQMTPEQQEGYRAVIEIRVQLGGPSKMWVHNPERAKPAA